MSEITSRPFDPFRASKSSLMNTPLSTEFSVDKTPTDLYDSEDESSTKSGAKRVSFEDVLNAVLENSIQQPVPGSAGTVADTKPGVNSAGFSKSPKEWGLQG